jgi:carboxyl-terminal processing protease
MTDQTSPQPRPPAADPDRTLPVEPALDAGQPDPAGPAHDADQPGPASPAAGGFESRHEAWLEELASSPGPAPLRPVLRDRSIGTGTLLVSVFVIAVLAGSALFVAGYSLGRQRTDTPGTSDGLQQVFQPFWDAYHKIDEEYIGDVDTQRLVEGAIDGMFQALGDPYSQYMTSEEYQNALSSISGQFEGIGAEMTSRDDAGEAGCSPAGATCHLVIVRTLRASPARRAGLRADDEVLAVDGQSVVGKTLDDVVTSVRGKRGTKVTLTIQRDDRAPFDVTVVRDVIKSEDVASEVLANGRVGYIRINGFSSGAAGDFKDQLRELVKDDDLDKLILDLRDDPGGFVEAARTIASQFVGSGPVFYEEYADSEPEPQVAEPDGIATDPGIDLVVLVNGGTASASEIVAGAIQDTGRGRLVGEKTFGKGTIQQWQTLPNAGGFRLSVAKWLTPKERWINEKGLEPDVVVTQPEDLPEGDDPQLDRAIAILLDQAATPGLRIAA